MLENFGKENFETETSAFAENSKLACYFILAVSPIDDKDSSKLRREMIIHTLDSDLLN